MKKRWVDKWLLEHVEHLDPMLDFLENVDAEFSIFLYGCGKKCKKLWQRCKERRSGQ